MDAAAGVDIQYRTVPQNLQTDTKSLTQSDGRKREKEEWKELDQCVDLVAASRCSYANGIIVAAAAAEDVRI